MGKLADLFAKLRRSRQPASPPPEIKGPLGLNSDPRKKRPFPFAEKLPPLPPIQKKELKILSERPIGKPPMLNRPKKR